MNLFLGTVIIFRLQMPCVGPGHPLPLSIHFPIFCFFIYFSFSYSLYLLSYIHPFPFYWKSPAPFPGHRSQEATEAGFSILCYLYFVVKDACLFYCCIWLWSLYGIGQTIIFSSCGFFLSSSIFFPRLISAATHWMSTILRHMVWP